MKAFAKKQPLIYTAVTFFIGLALMEALQKLFVLRGLADAANADLFKLALVRLAAAAAVAWFVWNLSGKKSFRHKKGAFGYALKVYLPALLPFALLAVFAFISTSKSPREPGFGLALLKTVALCVSVGLFEELIFRVLPCDGLMRALKGKKCAFGVILWVPAAVFGLVHVVGSVGALKDTTAAATFVFKVVECMLSGVILMLLFLRDRDYWAIAAVHMLFDLFPLLLSLFAGNTGFSLANGYVASGKTGFAALGVNGIVILIELIILLRLRKKLIPKLDFDRLIEEW